MCHRRRVWTINWYKYNKENNVSQVNLTCNLLKVWYSTHSDIYWPYCWGHSAVNVNGFVTFVSGFWFIITVGAREKFSNSFPVEFCTYIIHNIILYKMHIVSHIIYYDGGRDGLYILYFYESSSHRVYGIQYTVIHHT